MEPSPKSFTSKSSLQKTSHFYWKSFQFLHESLSPLDSFRLQQNLFIFNRNPFVFNKYNSNLLISMEIDRNSFIFNRNLFIFHQFRFMFNRNFHFVWKSIEVLYFQWNPTQNFLYLKEVQKFFVLDRNLVIFQ